MKYTLRENLSSTSGVVSNLNGFLYRFNDTGFKTKWTGYWSPPFKYLDYFAVKVNGVWLGPGTLEGTEYGDSMTHHHELDSLRIREKIRAPPELPGFRLELDVENITPEPKAVRVEVEPAVDIRHKSDDIGPESYSLDQGKNRLSIIRDDRKLNISSGGESFELEEIRETKLHEPGEPQRCFIPGRMAFNRETAGDGSFTIGLEFTTSGGSFRDIETVETRLEDSDFARTFQASVESLENLTYHLDGTGLIAGHPWFQSYWARDSFWSLLGLIDAGHFNLAEEILENFVENGLSSRIMINQEGDDWSRADTEPLFIIAADKLRRHRGVSDTVREGMEDAIQKLETVDKTVENEPLGTWMDTLERPSAVDIQSLWLEAAKIMGDPRHKKLEEGLERFQEEKYMRDHLRSDDPDTINPAIPLMFHQVEEDRASRYLGKINAEFSSRYGARTRSMSDPGYISDGYHSGSAWGLTTGWAAAANLEYGKERQGINFLEKFRQFIDRNQLGALPETVDSETGKLLGAPEQAWSAGIFLHVLDTYLLGIEVEEDHVVIEPADISCIRRNKKVMGESLDIRFREGEAEIMNDPELDVKII